MAIAWKYHGPGLSRPPETNNRASVRFPYQPARSFCVLWPVPAKKTREPTRDARWTAPRHARPIRESAGSGIDRRASPTVGGVLTAAEEITTRKPLLLFRLSGVFLFRLAERVFLELLFHEPPRNTRFPRIPWANTRPVGWALLPVWLSLPSHQNTNTTWRAGCREAPDSVTKNPGPYGTRLTISRKPESEDRTGRSAHPTKSVPAHG